MGDLIACVRRVRGKSFDDEPGPTRFLDVPAGKTHQPAHEVSQQTWVTRVMKQAIWGKDSRTGADRGDVLVYVHGYNNTVGDVIRRQRGLDAGLRAVGFKGAVISFDWPSDDKNLAYLEDRHDAKQTAMQLVTDLIAVLSARQDAGCTVNVHLLAHSMGAYVVREAFDDADDARLPNSGWCLSQLCFIAGDVSSDLMSDSNPTSESLYRHWVRMTNYFSRRDIALKGSNAKRLGLAPRVGRVGLPEVRPSKSVDVDCTDYFAALESSASMQDRDQVLRAGEFSNSWYVGNHIFHRDLFETLRGDLDRHEIPMRAHDPSGLKLRPN